MYKCYPVDYISITTGYDGSHQAIDCGWWGDTSDRPIYSVSDGTVVGLRNDYNRTDSSGNSYGNYIEIENSDGSLSTYCHLKYQSVLVKVGDKVKQHQQIATMGNTGYSFGPHLHYEHRINGNKVNPFDYLYCFPDFQSINYDKPDAKYIKTKPEYKFKEGDMVVLNGYYHVSNETGSQCIGEISNYIGTITKIKDGEYPYNVDLVWCREKYLTAYEGKDYEQLYKQELLKNKDLEKQVDNLQGKINKAMEDLK